MKRLIWGLILTAISVMLLIVGTIVGTPVTITYLIAALFSAAFCPSRLPIWLHNLQRQKKSYKAMLLGTVKLFKSSFHD